MVRCLPSDVTRSTSFPWFGANFLQKKKHNCTTRHWIMQTFSRMSLELWNPLLFICSYEVCESHSMFGVAVCKYGKKPWSSCGLHLAWHRSATCQSCELVPARSKITWWQVLTARRAHPSLYRWKVEYFNLGTLKPKVWQILCSVEIRESHVVAACQWDPWNQNDGVCVMRSLGACLRLSRLRQRAWIKVQVE